MFLKNKNIIFKIRRSKVTEYAALSGHSKRTPKEFFYTDYRLMQVKSIAECSKWSIRQYFQPSLSYHLSIGSFFWSIFEWPLKTGFTVLSTHVAINIHAIYETLYQKTCLRAF